MPSSSLPLSFYFINLFFFFSSLIFSLDIGPLQRSARKPERIIISPEELIIILIIQYYNE